MTSFQLSIKTDNPGLDQQITISNYVVAYLADGAVEVHAFGGPGAQERYEAFVKSHERYISSKENQHATEERKETTTGPG
jgi:hypothetical protein